MAHATEDLARSATHQIAADSPAGRLNLGQRLGYGVADFGFNLYYASLSAFLLYYYTDVLGIAPAIAGLIFALALFWDAVTDPIMGLIADRTRTSWGRYRPYIVFGAIPLALSFVAMFALPILAPGAVILAAAATHVVFRTAYTVVSVPFTALSAAMTRDSGERGVLAGARMIFASLAGLAVALATLSGAELFGRGDERVGFVWVSVCYATLATIILFITAASTREQDAQEPPAAFSLRTTLAALARNRAALIVVAATVIAVSGSTMFMKALVYYVKYAAAVEIEIGSAIAIMSAATFLALPVWMALSARLEKRTIWLLGMAFSIATLVSMYLAPPQELAALSLYLIVIGVGSSAVFVTFWSMLPDTVEYGEWRTGQRDSGLIFGVMQLAVKASSAVGVGGIGLLLGWIGYRANVQQTPETIAALGQLTFLAPAALHATCAVIIAFYPITRRAHADLVRQLAGRAAPGASAQAPH